ncbi:hypothetical protein QKE52_10295 [Corynebacterium sp. c25Ua_47]|uniref:hypothetical protein n=1 Tax=Corynebacterium sp. c25Ua_47 TaxID=3032353 RepID=UPI003265D420
MHDTRACYAVTPLSSTGLNTIDFCIQLSTTKSVAATSLAAFTDGPEPWQYKMRLAFCKRPEVIREAVARLTSEENACGTRLCAQCQQIVALSSHMQSFA